MTTITRRSFVVGTATVLGTSVLPHTQATYGTMLGRIRAGVFVLMVVFLVPAAASAARLGTYTCQVETVYGKDFLGWTWKGAKLVYDADSGTLCGSFDPFGERGESRRSNLSRVFSRLHVETLPSAENNLVAVQYDRAGERGYIRPIVAWLMIETLGDQDRSGFQFFSNTIRAIVEGECVRGY